MKFMQSLAIAAIALMGIGCSNAQKADTTAADADVAPKVLVAYFSATGTTRGVAEKIADATGATLYEITPEPRYTDADLDWRDKQSRSSLEMADSLCRPALGGDSISTADYDVVFIGYPIWWNLAPRLVNTFIEANDLSGAKIIPFATSGSSTIDNSVADLKRLYPTLNWAEGKLLNDVDPAAWAAEALQ